MNIDWTAPVLSGVNDGISTDIDLTNDGSQLFANWQAATDPNSGIDRYEVAVGDVAGGANVYPFTNVGLGTSINIAYPERLVLHNRESGEWRWVGGGRYFRRTAIC